MGFRFRKSVKIAPGVRLNIGKKSVGISAGVKGARVSVNSKGRVTKTVGLPGTGLSYTKTGKIGGGAASSTDKHDQTAPEHTPTVDLPPIDPQPPHSHRVEWRQAAALPLDGCRSRPLRLARRRRQGFARSGRRRHRRADRSGRAASRS